MSDSAPTEDTPLCPNTSQHNVAALSSSFSEEHVGSLVLENKGLLLSILDYCDEKSRQHFIFLSSKQYSILTSDAAFKWRVECLHREYGIYHPPLKVAMGAMTSKQSAKSKQKQNHLNQSSWKNIFLQNNKIKYLWQKTTKKQNAASPITSTTTSDDDKKMNFHVQVSARFKPRNTNPMTQSNNHIHEKKISLPLYQRLALVKMNRNLKTKKEAFQALVEQGEWSYGEVKDDANDDDEKKLDDSSSSNNKPSLRGGVHLIDPNDKFVVLIDKTKGLRKFQFDDVFQDQCAQDVVYTKTTMPLICQYLNGFNVSSIVFGQTGSGKTHTMYGDSEFGVGQEGSTLPSSWGIVPRSIYEIWQAIEYRKKHINLDIDVELGVSYIEIFGESVTDLLNEGKSCGPSKVSTQRFVLDGSSAEKIVTSLEETFDLLNVGERQKRKAATAMNEHSSRAHSIFIMRMTQTCKSTGVTLKNRLLLADLGGSEQLKKSQPFDHGNEAQSDYDRKQRTREAVNINLGLLALKQCVEALNKKASFVPFTDSKLTMLLSSGLGGDSKTSIIVCGAQEQQHGTETIASMKFGQVCRGIYNNAKITNNNMVEELLENINNRIAACEENIRKFERWEMIKQVHKLDDGRIEEKQVTVVTGAEKYREELSQLVQQKMELTGDAVTTLYNKAEAIEGFGNAYTYNMGKKAE